MDWTDAAIAQLQSLWDAGHSTAEIGRRMGITKNAVVGKAHRLNLPPRPSPIRREPGPAPARVERRRATARPGFTPLRRPAPAPMSAVVAAPIPARAAVAPPPPPTAVIRPFPRAAQRHCCWPLGDPGTPDFRFCVAEALIGKPYCPDHAALAYVKPRDRREDAA